MAVTPVDPPVLQARLFGGFSLTDPQGASAVPSGRKARAIVACLLLAGDEGVTRERLAGLLWSRSGEDQARASLRQAFYDLRALAAGDHPVIGIDRARARLVPGRVRSDLDRLRDARQRGDAAAAADSVGDDLQELLSDLNGIDDGLDDWLRVERVRRSDERRGLLLDVADGALGSGDAAGAQRVATRLLTADPIDEAAARLAMRAARARGDSDAIRQVFARLEKALQAELGAEPSAETTELHCASMLGVATPAPALTPTPTPTPTPTRALTPDAPTVAAGPPVPTDGTASAAPVRLPAEPDAGMRGPVAAPGAPGPRRAAPVVAGAALAIALAAGVAWFFWQRSAAPAGPRLLLVRPLAAAEGDTAAHALAGGFPTDLARTIVGNDSTLAVVDPERANGVAPRGTDLVVTGDATTDAGTLRVNVKLRRAREATLVWSSSFARSAADAAVLRDEIATKVAGVLVCGFGGKRPAPADFDAQTLQLYLGACEQKYGDWAEAARLLGQVVERRPDYAHGWAMLAAGTSTSAYFRPAQAAELHRQALSYAERAIGLDPSDGEAYFAQADARPGIEHWVERMTILDAGHAADPTNASVNGARGSDLSRVGRWREAIAAVQQGVDAEPFSPVQIANLARLRAFGSSAEAAEATLAVGRARFPLVGYFARTEFRIAALLGDPRRAVAMLDDPRYRLSSGPAMTAAWRALIEARRDPSAATLDTAVRRIREDARASADPLPSMQKLMALNRVDDAYALAAELKARADGSQEILFARSMTAFRADPRFMTVAARMGLVPIWLATDRWPDFCDTDTLAYDCRVEARRAVSSEARPL